MKYTLTWKHTRTGLPTWDHGTYGQMMIKIFTIRCIYPDHKFLLNGISV